MRNSAREPANPLDLDSIQGEFRQQSPWVMAALVLTGIFSIVWIYACFFNPPTMDPETGFAITRRESYMLGVVGLAMWILCIYLWRSYQNERYVIEHSNIVYFGPNNREKFTIPLTDLAWVTVSDLGSDGWSCKVHTRSKDFTFTQMLRGHLQLAELLDRIARQNASITRRNLTALGDDP